ncbi:MAG: MFS transporter [Chloroflexota bacterium]
MQKARIAVAAIFFVNGAVLGSWATRIPAIQEHLGLSKGQLGIVLLMGAVGALAAMNVAGYLAARFGSRPVTSVSVLSLCASLPLLALAPGLVVLGIALFVLGAANGSVDVAMNAQGVEVERRYARPILNSFHALFSLGGLIGALAGGLLASHNVSPLEHFTAVAGALGVVALGALFFLVPSRADANGAGVAFALPTRAILSVGFVAFCTVVGEGAMADWSAVYLKGTVGTSAGLAAIGYASFSLLMVAGRITGDRLTTRFGPVALVRTGCFTASLGLSCALLVPWPPVALVGFGLVGAGLAVVFPITVSAAGRMPGLASSTAIAAVATCGYFGFLVGPAIIGFVAQLSNLRLALAIVVILVGICGFLARAVGRVEVPRHPATHVKQARSSLT